MQIQLLVRVPVMMAVVCRPPQHALLRRRHGHEGDDDLKRAAGFKRAMREIAMIPGRDEEHAHDEERKGSHEVIPMKGDEENQQRSKMSEKKRQGVKNGNPRAIRQRDTQIPRDRSHPAESSAWK